MTRVDLDALGHLADVAAAAQPPGGLTASLARRTHKLVAELRAAREVVEAARLHECGGGYQAGVWALIVAYDEAVGS